MSGHADVHILYKFTAFEQQHRGMPVQSLRCGNCRSTAEFNVRRVRIRESGRHMAHDLLEVLEDRYARPQGRSNGSHPKTGGH